MYFYQELKSQRKKAVTKSKDVTLWYVHEKLAPILPNFPYNYKDLSFLWKWVDYIVFDWLQEGHVKQVVFLEIKSWKSRLNQNEKLIKTAIDTKKVRYETIRIKKK